LERARSLGINVSMDNRWIVTNSDVVILAVKPFQVENVLKEVRDLLDGKVLVSLVPFATIDRIRELIGDGVGVEIYRAMPNVNVEINAGFTALTGSGMRRDIVGYVFGLLGRTVWVEEKVLDLLTLLTACTPAIIAEILDAFMLAGLYLGIPKEIVEEAVVHTFVGTSMNVLRNGVYSVRNRVITPRGLTIKMIKHFLRTNVKYSIVESIVETYRELEKAMSVYT